MRGARAGLAMLAAAAALASFGVASASATNLCSEKQTAANECPAGKAYGVGQVFEATSANVELETEALGAITCKESALVFKVTELLVGFAAQAQLQTFSFGKCVEPGNEPCTLAFNPLPPKVQILQTGGGNGDFFVQDPAKGKVFLKLTCGMFLFELSAKEAVAKMTGGNGATISFTQAFAGGALGESELKGTYATTNPKPVWVAK